MCTRADLLTSCASMTWDPDPMGPVLGSQPHCPASGSETLVRQAAGGELYPCHFKAFTAVGPVAGVADA